MGTVERFGEESEVAEAPFKKVLGGHFSDKQVVGDHGGNIDFVGTVDIHRGKAGFFQKRREGAAVCVDNKAVSFPDDGRGIEAQRTVSWPLPGSKRYSQLPCNRQYE